MAKKKRKGDVDADQARRGAKAEKRLEKFEALTKQRNALNRELRKVERKLDELAVNEFMKRIPLPAPVKEASET